MRISRKYLVVSIKGIFILLLTLTAYYLLHTTYYAPTFAQTPACGSGTPARNEGLVTTPIVSGKFLSLIHI